MPEPDINILPDSVKLAWERYSRRGDAPYSPETISAALVLADYFSNFLDAIARLQSAPSQPTPDTY